jgi:hypothetical protein
VSGSDSAGGVGAGVQPGGTFLEPLKHVGGGSSRGLTCEVGGWEVRTGGGGGTTGAGGGTGGGAGALVADGRPGRAGPRVTSARVGAGPSAVGTDSSVVGGGVTGATVGTFARLGAPACAPSPGPRRDAAHSEVAATTTTATRANPDQVATIAAVLRRFSGGGGGASRGVTAGMTEVGMSSARTTEVGIASKFTYDVGTSARSTDVVGMSPVLTYEVGESSDGESFRLTTRDHRSTRTFYYTAQLP